MSNASTLLLFLVLTVSPIAKSTPVDDVIKIVTEHLPPYQIGQNSKLVGGFVGQEIKSLIKTVLPTSTIEVMPWARAYRIALNYPNTIIFSLVRTPEREEQFIWIGKVAQVTTKLITLKESNYNAVSHLSEIVDMKIGVKRQDAVAHFLHMNGFKFNNEMVEIVNTISTMKMLEKGRIDAIPANNHIIKYYCETTGCNISDFKTIYTFTELSEDFYLAVSLGTDPSLIKQLRSEFINLNLPVR